MDDLDKKLYHDLNVDIEIPSYIEKAITEGWKKEKTKNAYCPLPKLVAIACACLLATTGIVYAGTMVIKNIWKEPEKVISNTEYQETTEEEKLGKAISESEAKEKASEKLELFGYQNEKIESIELKNNVSDHNSVWKIKTNEGTLIDFSADDGSYFSIGRNADKISKDFERYEITKEEAEKRAVELCEEYGYNLEQYNQISVEPYLQWNNWQEQNSKSSQWSVIFSKTCNNGINSYKNIHIEFISGIEKLEVYFFCVEDAVYEDNPIEIAEGEAEQIVLSAEQNINTEYKITNIYTNLDVALMNGNAYQRMTDYEQYCKQYYGENTTNSPATEFVSYRTERRVRNAWMVSIEYEGKTQTGELSDPYYTYYIDATTGEIIGGNPIYYMIKLQE